MSLKSDDEGEQTAEDGESIAEMEEVDLLGGLADGTFAFVPCG